MSRIAQRATGLLPRREETREFMASERHLTLSGIRETIVQPIAWIRDQRRKPSCVGQAFAAGIDTHLAGTSWVSAVDLWEDARRRQGRAEGILDGTRAEYVIASMMRRGWSPYKRGEDARPTKEDGDGRASSLRDELAAHDRRQLGVVNYDISRNRVDNVIAALQAGYVVCGGWGLSEKFGRAPANTILDPSYLNADGNGHEMRIVGYDADARVILLQNSWNKDWSWCEFAGEVYHGCTMISEEALEVAWDLDAVQVRLK